ncbi:MAG: hypothetical protein ICV63_12110, partial [Coleofasciculus sp. Co-bin14]|nr:hypothetical protein [Coleofasciculus sp. Co-bin14]
MDKNNIQKKDFKKLQKSFAKVYDIYNQLNEVKLECKLKDEAKEFNHITPDEYRNLFAEYCQNKRQNPSLFEKILRRKKISSLLNLLNARSAVVISIFTFLIQQIIQHHNATEQYKEAALTKYLDEIRELLIKQNEGNINSKNNIVQDLANVRTITTLQL